jgi:hypothetical protein
MENNISGYGGMIEKNVVAKTLPPPIDAAIVKIIVYMSLFLILLFSDFFIDLSVVNRPSITIMTKYAKKYTYKGPGTGA